MIHYKHQNLQQSFEMQKSKKESVFSMEAKDVTKALEKSHSSLLRRPNNQMESSDSNAYSSQDIPRNQENYLQHSREGAQEAEEGKNVWVLASPKFSCQEAIDNLVRMRSNDLEPEQEESSELQQQQMMMMMMEPKNEETKSLFSIGGKRGLESSSPIAASNTTSAGTGGGASLAMAQLMARMSS